MKKLLLAVSMMAALGAFAQKVSVTFGDELKLRRGSTDLDVIYVDKSGLFLQEKHAQVGSINLITGLKARESAALVKLDKAMNLIYQTDFNKELKGKDYEAILFIKGKMLLLASSFDKKKNDVGLFGAELDPGSGEMKGEWKLLHTIVKDSRKSNMDYSIDYNFDSSTIVIATAVENTDDVGYEFLQFDEKLNKVGNNVNISYPITSKLFDVERLIFTRQGKLLIVTRVNEYEEGKKEKNKFIQLKEYDIRLYDAEGKLVKQLNTGAQSGKYIVQNNVRLMKDGNFALGAFYSDNRKRKEITGMLFARFNGETGELINQGDQAISNTMLTTVPDESDDDEEESRAERKERQRLEKMQEDEGGISRSFRIKEFTPSNDGGLIMLAEKFYTYITYSSSGTGRTTTQVHDVYGDLLFVKVSPQSTIEWTHMLPKVQDEVVASSSSNNSIGGISFSAFRIRRPATYSSFGVMNQPNSNNMLLFFLDNPKNAKVLNAGQKAKRMVRINKANCDMLVVDETTGNYTRKTLFNNEDETDGMPSMGGQFGKDYYMVAKKWVAGFGKSKVAVARLSVK